MAPVVLDPCQHPPSRRAIRIEARPPVASLLDLPHLRQVLSLSLRFLLLVFKLCFSPNKPCSAMAFMMPVVKNDYYIYPSCPSSRAGSSIPQSRGSSLSSSPSAASSFVSSPRHSRTPAFHHSKSESQNSLHRFHSKVLDKLRKTFRGNKDGSSDDIHQTSTSLTIR